MSKSEKQASQGNCNLQNPDGKKKTKEQTSHPTKTFTEISTYTNNHPKLRGLEVWIKITNSKRQGKMFPINLSYITIAGTEYSNINEAREKDLKVSYKKVIDILKKEINESCKVIQKNTNSGRIADQLRILDAIANGLNSIFSTHMVAHNNHICNEI